MEFPRSQLGSYPNGKERASLRIPLFRKKNVSKKSGFIFRRVRVFAGKGKLLMEMSAEYCSCSSLSKEIISFCLGHLLSVRKRTKAKNTFLGVI